MDNWLPLLESVGGRFSQIEFPRGGGKEGGLAGESHVPMLLRFLRGGSAMVRG